MTALHDWLTGGALSEGIAAGQLHLVYMPKIDLATRDVVGFEALVRWRHPDHGIVMPSDFVALAERAKLMEPLTRAVTQIGVAELAMWRPGLSLAINISGQNLDELSFVERLDELCAKHGVSAERVVLELEESSATSSPLHGGYMLNRLRMKAFELAIDNFGTGYSSVAQLAKLPFSEIKVDKAFVRDTAKSVEARAIVRSIVDLAHNLGMRAVAKGVEDTRVLRQMILLGCDFVQGFLISRPLEPEAIPAWLDDWDSAGRTRLDASESSQTAPARELQAPWAKQFDGSDEMRLALTQLLADRIQPMWDLGRNSLIGWHPTDRGIDVLMAPYQSIVDRFAECQRLLQGRRLMGRGTFQTVQEVVGCTAHHIRLPFRIADHEVGAVPTDAVEQVLRRYGITETQHRAVALFDIVGFSKVEPKSQVSQLNSLECSINTAHGILQDLGKSIDLARTTTGDGFYIWNREKGAQADLDTYLLTMLTLADNAIARRSGRQNMVPELRACYSVGPHYSYYQVDGLDPRGHDYIVGDVTIGLARMIGNCQPGQVLIGDFRRPTDPGMELSSPVDFVIKADGAFEAFNDVHLQGKTVSGIRCYLTGPERGDGGFDIQRFRIRDKHGFDHFVFNQKFNVHLRDVAVGGSDALYLGRRHADIVEIEGLEIAPR